MTVFYNIITFTSGFFGGQDRFSRFENEGFADFRRRVREAGRQADIRRRIEAGQAWERWEEWNRCARDIGRKHQFDYDLEVANHRRRGAGIVGVTTVATFAFPGWGTLASALAGVGVQGIDEYNSYVTARNKFLNEAQQKCGQMPAKPARHN